MPFLSPRVLLWLLPAAFLGLSSCLLDSDDRKSPPRPPSDTLSYRQIAVSAQLAEIDVPAGEKVKLRFDAIAGATYRIEVQLMDTRQTPFWLNIEPGFRIIVLARHSLPTSLAIDFQTPSAGICFLSLSNLGSYLRMTRVRVVPLVDGSAVDDFESDDRRADAQEYRVGRDGNQWRTLAGSDTDWIRFQADSGWHYAILASWLTDPHPAALRTELFGPDSALIGARTSTNGTEPPLYARIRRSGTYYLRITDSGRQDHKPDLGFGSYALLVEGAPMPDSDDTHLSAARLPIDGSPQFDRIRSPGDEDWFRFEVKAGRKYIIEATSDSFDASLSLKLDPDDPQFGPELATHAFATSRTARIEWLAPFSGATYIQAASWAATVFEPRGTGPYFLRVLETDKTPKFDLYEPDDSLALAKLVAVNGEPEQRSIHAEDDDIVAFDADSGAVYAVTLPGLPRDLIGPYRIRFLDAAGSPISDSTYGYSWQEDRLVFHAPRSGRTFLRIAGTYAAGGTFPDTAPVAFYSLGIRTLPQSGSLVDSFESDDTPEEAKAIATDGTPQSRALIGTNWDWVRFLPDSGKTYEIVLSPEGIPAGVDLLHFPRGPIRPLYQSQVSLAETPFATGLETRFLWSCDRSFAAVWQQSAFLRIAVATYGSYAFRYTISVREQPEATIPPPTPQ